MLTERKIPLARIDKSQDHSFDYQPSTESLNGIIQNLDLRKLIVRRFTGTLHPLNDGWNLEATLEATPTQACIISGAPIHTPLTLRISRNYRKLAETLAEDITLAENFDDTIEALPQVLDLDDLLNESIALNISLYPRLTKYLTGDEWSIQSENYDEEKDAELQRPFAGLDELLKAKKSEESDS